MANGKMLEVRKQRVIDCAIRYVAKGEKTICAWDEWKALQLAVHRLKVTIDAINNQ